MFIKLYTPEELYEKSKEMNNIYLAETNYKNFCGMSLDSYLELCQQSKKNDLEVLSEEYDSDKQETFYLVKGTYYIPEIFVKEVIDKNSEENPESKWIVCGMFDDFLRCPHCQSEYVAERVQSEEWIGCPKCLNPVKFI